MWNFGVLLALFTFISGMTWTENSKVEPPQPYFEPSVSSVMVRPGQSVQLPCRVRHLGDRIVSWIRRRDLHILASAGFAFTADERFSVIHLEGDSAAWTLQLRSAVPADQGLYECQVNTEPKMKQAVLLTVSDVVSDDATDLSMGDDAAAGGSTRILGPQEQYVKAGMMWTLTCEVTGLPARAAASLHSNSARLVDWLYEGHLLTYQSSRGGISVDTEHADGQTVSRLTLAKLSTRDTGRYVCKPLSLPKAVVTIIIVEDETTAMLERNFALVPALSWWLLTLYVALLVRPHHHRWTESITLLRDTR